MSTIAEVADEIRLLDEEYRHRRQQLVKERDELVADAVGQGVTIRRLQEATQLSRTRLYQLRADASEAVIE